MPALETPWGSWEVLLEETYCKVKRLIVNPRQRLSYQKHAHREEVWTVVQGTATVTLQDQVQELATSQTLFVPCGQLHRIANKTDFPVVLIEVQTGTYFGEDDIERFEDDYGRV